MTALEQYARLEAPGRWREAEGADWREVVVSFGNATLVLSDYSEAPLTHWSLAAVQRIEQVGGTALFAPDAGTAEVVEISDQTMIDAIAEVTSRARLPRPGPVRPRRARWPVLFALGVGGVAALLYWGPDALRNLAVDLVSPEQATQLSARILENLPIVPCRTAEGTEVLRGLAARLGADVLVLPWDGPPVARLPDGTVLISQSVAEETGSAEGVAGWVAVGAVTSTPLEDWIGQLDPLALGSFLVRGEIEDEAVRWMSDALTVPTSAIDEADTVRAAEILSDAGVEPRILSTMVPAPTALSWPDPDDPRPVLAGDRDWVALQNICRA